MGTKSSSDHTANGGTRALGHSVLEELSEVISQLRTLELTLAGIRDFDDGVVRHPLPADEAVPEEPSFTKRASRDQSAPAWHAERECSWSFDTELAIAVRELRRLLSSLTELVTSVQQGTLSPSERQTDEWTQREEAFHQLEARLKDSVRQIRNGEEYTRQVMLELLRVRDAQEATERFAEATAERAAYADQQREEMRNQLRKSESARQEMEQTPGWWLLNGFHDQMQRSPMFAKAIGLAVKAGRGLRLLPAGCTEEVRRIAPLVDQEFYFRTYPDARAWGVPAAEHYFRLGARKGYNPSAAFNTQFYLAKYPEVDSAGVNPLMHYLEVGAAEGRQTIGETEATGDRVSSGGYVDQQLSMESPVTPQAEPKRILPERFAVRPHEDLVSIIVTVHNALDFVRACLSSILLHTLPPYELIVVDDGSEPETRDYLREFASLHGAVLIRSETASGYTFAANRGLRAARGEYALLLNSDTVVTDTWLDRMLMCAQSDSQIGIVGPLSNRANWQSIPEAVIDGHWADNDLPQDWTANDMARAVAEFTSRAYPRIPFLNGFCFLIKRQVINSIGYFDEENFGRGYGEENDYCLRAREKGWVMAVADDAYVYHARTISYTAERRDELSEVAHRMLYTKHKKVLVDRSGEQARDDLVLLGIRAHASQFVARKSLIAQGQRWMGKRIAFVLSVGEHCRAADVIIAEAKAMENLGATVLIVNLLANMQAFRSSYPELDVAVIFVPSSADLHEAVRGCDAVVATTSDSIVVLKDVFLGMKGPSLAYYVHDFEPGFFPMGLSEHPNAESVIGSIPNLIRVARTQSSWEEALRRMGVDCVVVGPSCDVDLFRPRVAPSTGKLQLGAVIRPSWPGAATRETLEVLAELDRQFGDHISIHLLGADSCVSLFRDLPRRFRYTNQGVPTRMQRAALLSGQDIFVELFPHPATELTVMEAMASGVATVLPKTGRCDAFAVHGENSIIVDASDRATCLRDIGALIEDRNLLATIRRRAVMDIVRFWPEQTAFTMLSALFPGEEAGAQRYSNNPDWLDRRV